MRHSFAERVGGFFSLASSHVRLNISTRSEADDVNSTDTLPNTNGASSARRYWVDLKVSAIKGEIGVDFHSHKNDDEGALLVGVGVGVGVGVAEYVPAPAATSTTTYTCDGNDDPEACARYTDVDCNDPITGAEMRKGCPVLCKSCNTNWDSVTVTNTKTDADCMDKRTFPGMRLTYDSASPAAPPCPSVCDRGSRVC